ncbi:hypothetical protein [Actinomadura hibisca]|uniref:hypothetical protein n=1 Tax=Actinomadura hibisca TaxID=68565 RepID=UPI0012F77E2E|nr:hypothetical protein [Actinomadura hibisca]
MTSATDHPVQSPVPAVVPAVELSGRSCPLCGSWIREAVPVGDGLVAVSPCGCVIDEG